MVEIGISKMNYQMYQTSFGNFRMFFVGFIFYVFLFLFTYLVTFLQSLTYYTLQSQAKQKNIHFRGKQ